MNVHVPNVKLYNHMHVLMYNNTYNIHVSPLAIKLNGDNTHLICNKNLHFTLYIM